MIEKHLIGFTYQHEDAREAVEASCEKVCVLKPKQSVVSVYFPQKKRSYTYYNNQFDLKKGDLVFVDGKMAGLSGFVEAINYNFKIKLSDYKRVISVANTDIHGNFYMTESFALTFEKNALEKDKIRTWFFPPVCEEDEFVRGSDDAAFPLEDIETIIARSSVPGKTYECYREENVLYLSLHDTAGYAIVIDSCPYEVEFVYRSGDISDLVCSCYCCNDCSHKYAVLLELCDIFKIIQDRFENEYEDNGYFAAVRKDLLMNFAGREKGNLHF